MKQTITMKRNNLDLRISEKPELTKIIKAYKFYSKKKIPLKQVSGPKTCRGKFYKTFKKWINGSLYNPEKSMK